MKKIAALLLVFTFCLSSTAFASTTVITSGNGIEIDAAEDGSTRYKTDGIYGMTMSEFITPTMQMKGFDDPEVMAEFVVRAANALQYKDLMCVLDPAEPVLFVVYENYFEFYYKSYFFNCYVEAASSNTVTRFWMRSDTYQTFDDVLATKKEYDDSYAKKGWDRGEISCVTIPSETLIAAFAKVSAENANSDQ